MHDILFLVSVRYVEEKDAPNWDEVSRYTEAASDGEVFLENQGSGLVENLNWYREEWDYSNPYFELEEKLFEDYSDLDEVWNDIDLITEKESVSVAEGIHNKGKGEGIDLYWDYGWGGPSDLKATLNELGTYLDALYNLESNEGFAEEEILDELDDKKGEASDVKKFMRSIEAVFLN